jgi:hypothetical protein
MRANASIIIQKFYRGWCSRKEAIERNKSIINIQKNYRIFYFSRKVNRLFKFLPDDLRQLVIIHIENHREEQLRADKLHLSIRKILYERIRSLYFIRGRHQTDRSIRYACQTEQLYHKYKEILNKKTINIFEKYIEYKQMLNINTYLIRPTGMSWADWDERHVFG